MDLDDLKVWLVVIMIVVLLEGGLVAVANILSGISCRESYAPYQPQYSIMTGCRIMWKGVLTPTDIVRTID